MRPSVILDTGPLVAAINHQDAYYDWVMEQFKILPYPLFTCEAVITEAGFLLRRRTGNIDAIFKLRQRGLITVPFHFDDEHERIEKLIAKYVNVPMSFADACLVRMSEQHPNGVILTLDSDFRVYRKFGNQIIPVMMPGIQ
jgi:uncharacterized protein